MTKAEFLEGLNEELEFDTPLEFKSDIKGHEEWDSMGAMILIGYVSSKTGITLTGEDIQNLKDVNSLIEKVGTDKFQ